MNRMIFLTMLIAGVVLVVLGIQASDSLGSDISRFFNDSPTDESIWMLLGGAALGVVGLAGALIGSRAAA